MVDDLVVELHDVLRDLDLAVPAPPEGTGILDEIDQAIAPARLPSAARWLWELIHPSFRQIVGFCPDLTSPGFALEMWKEHEDTGSCRDTFCDRRWRSANRDAEPRSYAQSPHCLPLRAYFRRDACPPSARLTRSRSCSDQYPPRHLRDVTWAWRKGARGATRLVARGKRAKRPCSGGHGARAGTLGRRAASFGETTITRARSSSLLLASCSETLRRAR